MLSRKPATCNKLTGARQQGTRCLLRPWSREPSQSTRPRRPMRSGCGGREINFRRGLHSLLPFSVDRRKRSLRTGPAGSLWRRPFPARHSRGLRPQRSRNQGAPESDPAPRTIRVAKPLPTQRHHAQSASQRPRSVTFPVQNPDNRSEQAHGRNAQTSQTPGAALDLPLGCFRCRGFRLQRTRGSLCEPESESIRSLINLIALSSSPRGVAQSRLRQSECGATLMDFVKRFLDLSGCVEKTGAKTRPSVPTKRCRPPVFTNAGHAIPPAA